jgi:hypothetical protein
MNAGPRGTAVTFTAENIGPAAAEGIEARVFIGSQAVGEGRASLGSPASSAASAAGTTGASGDFSVPADPMVEHEGNWMPTSPAVCVVRSQDGVGEHEARSCRRRQPGARGGSSEQRGHAHASRVH